MKRGGWLKRKTRLQPMSERRKSEVLRRREVVEQVRRRDGNRCQAAGLVRSVICCGPLDPHEIIPRSSWRAGYLEPDNVVIVCRAHHDWIGDNPLEAEAVGLHGWSWQRPCSIESPCRSLNPEHVQLFGECIHTNPGGTS